MARLEIRPFEPGDVQRAGVLLADRHRRHRGAQPLLSPAYEQPDAAATEVADLAGPDRSSGAVAVRGGATIGFLLGTPKPGEVWGPNVWVEAAGQAVTEAEVMRDLYAVAAEQWVAAGLTAHYVLVPATDDGLVRAWFRLGFGQQQAHGIRALSTDPAPACPPDVTIRRAARADIPTLARLELELPAHQGLSPTFSAGHAPSYEESVDQWGTDFDDDSYTVFVAEHDGQVIGSAVGTAVEKSNTHAGLCRPDGASLLGFAAVSPAARGLGAGRALGEAFLSWSVEAGFTCAVTDWRVTNLLSSRTWPSLGFNESFLRLHRLIRY